MTDRGILYVATREPYLSEAAASARSMPTTNWRRLGIGDQVVRCPTCYREVEIVLNDRCEHCADRPWVQEWLDRLQPDLSQKD